MRITIEDFKGIAKVENFRLEQISVLVGANSGGKSSLVQLLMLLKQSIEARSQKSPLKLNKPYVSLGRFENLLRREPGVKSFKVDIALEAADLSQRLVDLLSGKRKLIGVRSSDFSLYGVKEVQISVEFKKPSNNVVVSNFQISLLGANTSYLKITRKSHGKSQTIESNAFDLFVRFYQFDDANPQLRVPFKADAGVQSFDGDVDYLAFFPYYIDLQFDKAGEYLFTPLVGEIRNSLTKAFERISYIGPLREEPREFYYHDDDLVDHIGNKGENAAFLLSKHADDLVRFTKFELTPDGPKSSIKNGTLKQAVNYWLCEVFGLAKAVKVDRAKTNRYLHSVTLQSRDGNSIPITHVGFGVSQIFPILVEGLRSDQSKRLIILEQPEIHLHPRVQSWLFDFIRTAPNSSFLVETHSDHFINRLRRRVAEDDTNELHKNINLTFVSSADNGTQYETLELSSTGSLDRWPDGFFDQYEEDVRAIVRAQAAKRRSVRG